MGLVCGFPLDASCASPAGVCLAVVGCAGTGKQPTFLGCDGGTLVRSCNLPGGYAQSPTVPGGSPPNSSVNTEDAGPQADAADADAY
jgi:hypothetical protein